MTNVYHSSIYTKAQMDKDGLIKQTGWEAEMHLLIQSVIGSEYDVLDHE